MTQLADMEELTMKVEDPTLRPLMKEAYSCYAAGAFRGAIVLCFIAIYHHLLSRLRAIANTSRDARQILEDVERRLRDQEVYETPLADQVRSKKLISELDADFLNIVKILRNKSAHPSGHAPTAEEVRFVFREAVERFLSKSVLSSSFEVDDILVKLDQDHFLVGKNLPENAIEVQDELSGMSENFAPMLIDKVIDKLKSSDAKVAKKCRLFLLSLARMDRVDLSGVVFRCLVKKRLSDGDLEKVVLGCVALKSEMLDTLSDVDLSRLRSMLSSYVDRGELIGSTNIFNQSVICGQVARFATDRVFGVLSDILWRQAEKDLLHTYVVRGFLVSPITHEAYFEKLLGKITSDDFDEADDAIKTVIKGNHFIVTVISPVESLMVIASIKKSAKSGAPRALDVVNSRFTMLGDLTEIALSFFTDECDEALEIFNEVAGENVGAEEFGLMIVRPVDDGPNVAEGGESDAGSEQ